MKKSSSTINIREEHNHYHKLPLTSIRPSFNTNNVSIINHRISNSSHRHSGHLKANKSTLNASVALINMIPMASKDILYEETLQLKKVVNKLANHIAMIKSDIRKKETNIFLKDKIIENSTFNVAKNKEKIFDKLIDTNNISKIKNAFSQLKIEYQNIIEANNNTKQMIKYSKPFEVKGRNEHIQNDISTLMNEYSNLQRENNLLEIEIHESMAFANEFAIQHQMVTKKEKEYEELKQRIENLYGHIKVLNDEITANETNKKKLSLEKMTMIKRINKINAEKRNQEAFMKLKPGYDLKIKDLSAKVEDYKRNKGNNDKIIIKLQAENNKLVQLSRSQRTILKPIDYNELKHQESDPNINEDPKILLLQSMINESQQKQKKMMLKIESDAQMLEEFGISITPLESIKQEINTLKIGKPLIADIIQFNEPKLISQGQIRISSPSINSNGRVKSYENLQNNLRESRDKNQELNNPDDSFTEMTYVIIKCFEAKNIPSGVVLDRMLNNIIIPNNNPNMTKEIFIQTMSDNIIGALDCNDKDIKDIKQWVEKMYIRQQNDINKVLALITSLFGNIKEYSPDEDIIYSKKLKKSLVPHKEKLKAKFDNKFKESNGFISFLLLKKFLEEEKVDMKDAYSEFLFFKLKQFPKTPNISLYDLDLKILYEIFDNTLNESKMNIKTENDLEISQDDYVRIVTQFILILKNYLTTNNTTINKLLSHAIEIILNTTVIHIDVFVDEMRKINIILNTDLEQFCLFNRYKLDANLEYLSVDLIENDINCMGAFNRPEQNRIMENVQEEEDDESNEK